MPNLQEFDPRLGGLPAVLHGWHANLQCCTRLTPPRPAPCCCAPAGVCALQMTGLTRLRSLKLKVGARSDRFRLLTRLPALERLELDTTYLPDCLWEIKPLRALTLIGYYRAPEVEAALSRLRHLTQLVLQRVAEVPPALAGLSRLQRFAIEIKHIKPGGNQQLPGGPWLASLRQLAAPADMLADSPQVLAGAAGLEQVFLTDFFAAHYSAQYRILSWAGEHPALRHLSLAGGLGGHCGEASFRAVGQAMARNPALSFSFGKFNGIEELWPEPPLFEPWHKPRFEPGLVISEKAVEALTTLASLAYL